MSGDQGEKHEVHLNVLPSSGKAEQLRQEAQREPVPAKPAWKLTDKPSEQEPEAGLSQEQRNVWHQVVGALRTVYDPELPVNLYDLGLIYRIEIKPDLNVDIKMTLTAPGCPVAGTLPVEVKKRVEQVAGVANCDVEIVWDPPWDRSMMSEAAMLDLGML